ncbi:MAG: hypothetical protein ABSG32_17875 [Terriglobia bacterium]
MGIVKVLYKWLFERLPRMFSACFILFAAAYYILAFSWLAYHLGPWIATKLVRGSNIAEVLQWISPVQVLAAFFTMGFALLGFFLAYGLAAYVYGFLRPKRLRSYPAIETPAAPKCAPAEGVWTIITKSASSSPVAERKGRIKPAHSRRSTNSSQPRAPWTRSK